MRLVPDNNLLRFALPKNIISEAKEVTFHSGKVQTCNNVCMDDVGPSGKLNKVITLWRRVLGKTSRGRSIRKIELLERGSWRRLFGKTSFLPARLSTFVSAFRPPFVASIFRQPQPRAPIEDKSKKVINRLRRKKKNVHEPPSRVQDFFLPPLETSITSFVRIAGSRQG